MFLAVSTIAFVLLGAIASGAEVPAPPDPEPIEVTELPLPPVAPSTANGSCTPEVNPHRTGCLDPQTNLMAGVQSGDFMPDGNHVLSLVTFTGAPAAPDPASIYTGPQIILIKTDGTTFPNNDSWKCLTCGVPAQNAVGRTSAMNYPQSFRDGKRLLVGTNIIDCGSAQLVSPECTPEKTYIYPIRWNVNADGTGEGGSIRELRLHPDNVHLLFSSFTFSSGGLGQFGYFSRLQFNPSPDLGTPLVPRYDLVNVTRLFNPEALQVVTVDGDQIQLNHDAISVGELRGFNGRGTEFTYVGYPVESSNIDVFAVGLSTGIVRRLTSHPEYCDPIAISPNDEWMAILDTRGSGRQMFMAGMRGIPALTDLVTTTVAASTRNNGLRRFFEPYLLDQYGDRGSYFGQKINGDNNGVLGSGAVNDPMWNGEADPRWSPDSTRLAFWQAQAISPACGGDNPLPCYPSNEPGGRTYRIMMAHFTSRSPVNMAPVEPVSDGIPWGVPYLPGSDAPSRLQLPLGNFTLNGKHSGHANVMLASSANSSLLDTVAVTYYSFSDDGATFLDGTERTTATVSASTINHVDWYSNLVQTGATNATKMTSPDGFHLTIDVLKNLFEANGTLTTTVEGTVYLQPANGT